MSDFENEELKLDEAQSEEMGLPEAEASSDAASAENEEPELSPLEIQRNNNRNMIGVFIRLLAGVYVIYMGATAIKDMIKNHEVMWYLVVVCVLLIVAGAAFVLISLKRVIAMMKEQNEEKKRMEEDPEYRKKIEEMRARELPTRSASTTPGSMTGADIRARLQAINAEDGLELTESYGEDEAEADETADAEAEAVGAEVDETEVDEAESVDTEASEEEKEV
ncbi:MAG: hypothetical protein Q4B73_03855 [Lachnospiraceae bacterium]|nr:hypothetical protein [Lachnospiraceae bacterium]